jgi:ATP-binding cassette subfamily C protein
MTEDSLVLELQKVGEVMPLGGNRTVDWGRDRSAWYVRTGEVNLFAVAMSDQRPQGKREYLFSVREGQLIVGAGMDPEEQKGFPFRLVMNGVADTELIHIDGTQLMERGPAIPGYSRLVREWEDQLLKWMQSAGASVPADFERIAFLKAVRQFLAESGAREAERLRRLAAVDRRQLMQSVRNLTDAIRVGEEHRPKATEPESDALLRTCQFIGQKGKIPITAPLRKSADPDPEVRLKQIAKASKIRMRQVLLDGEWWKRDNGHLLAFRKEDRRPVALILKRDKHYDMVDLVDQSVRRVNRETDLLLERRAYVFYRPFPARRLNLWDLMRFSAQTPRLRKDTFAMTAFGIIGGLLSLAIPMGLGELVDSIIPGAERGLMFDFVLILTAIAVASLTFQIARSIAMLRMEARLDSGIQSAVWDRVLNLPVPFFRKYSAGDLALRAGSVAAIRQALSGTTLSTIFSGVFSSTQFFLLFYYSSRLAWLATLLVAVAIAAVLLLGYVMIRKERQLADLQGKLTGIIFQIVGGVSKFRVAGAEKRAFGVWSDHFGDVQKAAFRTGIFRNWFSVFNAVYPSLATMLLFFGVIGLAPTMSAGAFLAFHSAFSGFIMSMMAMSMSIIFALNVIPLYERAKPILETEPEIGEEKEDPGELTGAIEVSHVDFRYDDDGDFVLKDVSIRVNPGEFVAIVGPSGSGKSTLLRLLLGFERPTFGAVYYDNHNLEDLDIQEVRSQLGVVLQGGQVLSGDIFTNIIGSSNLTMEDAWEAARMAGLEEDIKSMPMGMFTMVDDGARTLSGGQRQRLLIARALVHKPKIIFFDEATSALDNQTQKVVSDSIERLKATRVVIAHRLSTIMNADRIYVMENGRIVEEGTFRELMDRGGVFYDLAKRQMA